MPVDTVITETAQQKLERLSATKPISNYSSVGKVPVIAVVYASDEYIRSQLEATANVPLVDSNGLGYQFPAPQEEL